MSGIELIEIKSLSDFLALRVVRVKPAQRRFTTNLVLSWLQSRHPAVTAYSIHLSDDLIGYVMLVHASNPTQWIIERLTIDRDHQGQGHGYAVADRLVDMVYEFESSEIVIARYHPDNDTARRLFQRLKFEEQDELFRRRNIALLRFEFEEGADDDEDDNDNEDIELADEAQELEDRPSEIKSLQ